MLNLKLLSKIIGALLGIEAFLMFCCLFVSLWFGGTDTMPFLWSILITGGVGILFRLIGSKADNSLGRREAYLVVSLTWVLFSFFGALPFLLGGYIDNLTDAFFESMSGFTTTGATVIDYPEKFPKALLFWRSLTQWIGGLGIVFFTIAILPSMVGGSVKVFAAEATGPIRNKLHPRLSTSAKTIWVVYLVLTVACLLSYKICGMGWFDACCYSMTSTATGGFSNESSSIMTFHSAAEEYVCMIFCFLSGTNFTLLYMAATGRDIKKLLKNTELHFYVGMILIFSAFIAFELILRNHYDIERAIRTSLFQVISFITTTGLFSDDAAKWPHVTWVILAACMFFGGCAGSTAGGIKSIRGVMILKVIRNEFRQILHPNAVLPMKIDGQNVSQSKRVTLLSFLGLYIVLAFICSFTMIAAGIDNTNSITITLSALGNVGPTLGLEIGPTMSWVSLPVFAKWICAFLMLVGRLELFTVLVIFTPAFWKEN